MKTRTKLLLASLVVVTGILLGTAYASLTTRVVLNVGATYTGTSGLGTAMETLNLDYSIDLASGTGSGQANVIYSASRSLADDANEVLDFYASGSLKDAFGTALTMEKLKLLIIYNTSTTASLKVGGGAKAVNIFSDASDIGVILPGGHYFWDDPNGLNIKVDKDLNILHGGEGTTAITYKIIVAGVD